MRRVIISGTREELSAEDREIVIDVLASHLERATEIGVGDCPTGIDALARGFARTHQRKGLPVVRIFLASWREFGRKAGPLRNSEMVRWANELDTIQGVLLAFPGPTSRGRLRAKGASGGAGCDCQADWEIDR